MKFKNLFFYHLKKKEKRGFFYVNLLFKTISEKTPFKELVKVDASQKDGFLYLFLNVFKHIKTIKIHPLMAGRPLFAIAKFTRRFLLPFLLIDSKYKKQLFKKKEEQIIFFVFLINYFKGAFP